jgi:hypothetical protein
MKIAIAILGLAFTFVLCPLMGEAQTSKGAAATKSVSALHRSRFSIEKLSAREGRNRTYVDGEITNNANKEASTVVIVVRWFDKNGKVVATDKTYVSNLAPGETLPFHADTTEDPEITQFDAIVERAH